MSEYLEYLGYDFSVPVWYHKKTNSAKNVNPTLRYTLLWSNYHHLPTLIWAVLAGKKLGVIFSPATADRNIARVKKVP